MFVVPLHTRCTCPFCPGAVWSHAMPPRSIRAMGCSQDLVGLEPCEGCTFDAGLQVVEARVRARAMEEVAASLKLQHACRMLTKLCTQLNNIPS